MRAILLLLIVACGAEARAASRAPNCTLVAEDSGPDGKTAIRVEVVARGLEVPWALAFLPGGDLLVTERPGRIRLVRAGKLVGPPVARVDVDAGGEGGLMGLALDPKFSTNRRFFIYASFKEADRSVNRVERWVLAADHRSATREKVILDGLPRAAFHDGGRIHFGPDGMLYVSVGDGRQPERAQDPSAPNGKLLRITPDGAVPDDNPTRGSPVFLSGVRNCEAFAWPEPSDAKTLWLADHGPSGEWKGWHGADEIDVAHAGEDLGWPQIHLCDAEPGMTSPLLTWTDAVPPGGAAIYTGSKIPAWKGSLLVGVLGAKHLHRVAIDAKGKLLDHEAYLRGDPPNGYGRLREVEMGPDGALYVTTSNCDGRGKCPKDKDYILRITK